MPLHEDEFTLTNKNLIMERVQEQFRRDKLIKLLDDSAQELFTLGRVQRGVSFRHLYPVDKLAHVFRAAFH